MSNNIQDKKHNMDRFDALLNNSAYRLLGVREQINICHQMGKDNYANITKINANAIRFMKECGLIVDGYNLSEFGKFAYCELFR